MIFDGIFKKPITFCPWTQAPRCDGFCLPDVFGSQKCDGFCFAFNFGTKQERRFSNYLQHCSRSNLGWFQNLNSLLSCIHLPVFEGQQIPSQLSFSSIHSPSIVGSLRDFNSQIVFQAIHFAILEPPHPQKKTQVVQPIRFSRRQAGGFSHHHIFQFIPPSIYFLFSKTLKNAFCSLVFFNLFTFQHYKPSRFDFITSPSSHFKLQ